MLNYNINFTLNIPDSIPIDCDDITHKSIHPINSFRAILGPDCLIFGDLELVGVDVKASECFNCFPRKINVAGAISCHRVIELVATAPFIAPYVRCRTASVPKKVPEWAIFGLFDVDLTACGSAYCLSCLVPVPSHMTYS